MKTGVMHFVGPWLAKVPDISWLLMDFPRFLVQLDAYSISCASTVWFVSGFSERHALRRYAVASSARV